MVKQHELWSQMQQALGAIASNLSPAVREKLDDSPIDIPNIFALGVAYAVHPKPIELTHLRQRNPYSHQDTQVAAIQRLRDANFVNDEDVITQDAYGAYQALVDAQDHQAGTLSNLSDGEINRLNNLLQCIIETAEAQDLPNLTLANTQALPDTPVHRTYDLLARFATLRDDAHLKAWSHLDIEGYLYEAFSLVWDGTASNAETLMDVRGNRGYSVEDWQNALDTLVEMDWLINSDGVYQATESADTLRKDIEAKTDEIFYQSFSVLEQDGLQALSNLLSLAIEKFTLEPQSS